MSYADYGGFAYKNGELVEGRSDFGITPEGVVETPGTFPWMSMKEEIRNKSQYGHAVLGSGPVYVLLYKQSGVSLCVQNINVIDFYSGCETDREPQEFGFHGPDGLYRISKYYVETDNYYTLSQLIEPDDTIWTGFSGYGVGPGLSESDDYGADTDYVIKLLKETFPKSFNKPD